MMRNVYGVPGKKDVPDCRVVSGRGRRAGACVESDTSVDLLSGTVVPGCGRQDYDSGIGVGRGLSCLFSGTGVGVGFIPGSLWNVVGFIFVFGLILSAVLRRKEAESCSDEGMKKPPYIRMYGGFFIPSSEQLSASFRRSTADNISPNTNMNPTTFHRLPGINPTPTPVPENRQESPLPTPIPES